jgi:site-specific DNA recombinase
MRHYERLAERGVVRLGGRGGRAFGFEPDGCTVRSDDAHMIREVADRVLAGEPVGAVCRDLNARGYRTTAGNPWDHGALKKLMKRPRLAGLLARHGQIIGPAAWPAILERETWEAVVATLDGKATTFGYTTNARRYLLTGIALCGTCLQPVAIRHNTRSETLRGYGCINPACRKKVHRSVAHLDPYVEGHVLRRLQDPKIRERATAPDAKPLLDELARLERRREDKLLQFADDDDLMADVLRVSIRRIDEQIVEARGRLAASQATHALDGLWGITREEWARLPLARQRTAVQALVRVTILPSGRRGPGFDPDTVLIG